MGGGSSTNTAQQIHKGEFFDRVKAECFRYKRPHLKQLAKMCQYTYLNESVMVNVDEHDNDFKQLKKMHKMNKWDRKRAEKKNKEDHAKGLIDESTSDALLLTPLMLACKAGNVKIAKMLIDNGADLHRMSRFGETPLIMACKGMFAPDWLDWKRGKHSEVVDLLLSLDADVNIVDKLGYSPLKWAVQHGNVQLYQALLGWEPLVTKRDEVVLLEMARERKHYKLVMIMERALYEDREVILGHHAKHHAAKYLARLERKMKAASKKKVAKMAKKKDRSKAIALEQKRKIAERELLKIGGNAQPNTDISGMFESLWAKQRVRFEQGLPLEPECGDTGSDEGESEFGRAWKKKDRQKMAWCDDGPTNNLGNKKRKAAEKKKLRELKDRGDLMEQARCYRDARLFLVQVKAREEEGAAAAAVAGSLRVRKDTKDDPRWQDASRRITSDRILQRAAKQPIVMC